MRPLKIVAIVIGALLILVGLGLLVPGAFLLWAHETQRDETGFYETSPRAVVTDTYALVSPDFTVSMGDVTDWVPKDWAGTVRLRAISSEKEIFVGVGPSDQVRAYLAGVAYDEVQSFSAWDARLEFRPVPGSASPAPPGEQGFWQIALSGSAPPPVDWEVRSGDWTVVIMNADASPGIRADLSLGAKFDFLFPIAVGLAVAGVVFLLVGIVLVILGARPSRPEPGAPGPAGPAPYGTHPPDGYGDTAYPQDRYGAHYPPVDRGREQPPPAR